MERYVCIHGHFYQPPRENAWLETVEIQDSAYPFHDWNERITAECYYPNAVARILDGEGRIVQLTNNYSRISFNFGPTLLSWLQDKAPEVYLAILEADRDSQARFSGHGSALAQAYNHMILPLANRRDKTTQILWGMRDFEHRFGRKPEGLWLAETAVDLESLDIMAEMGIRFTILSPYQAGRFRGHEEQDWHNATDGRIDPSRPYLQRLPSGRTISLFFYDGPLSRAVAFEKLLTRGEDFANRLMHGFSDERDGPQLVHIATDGESYGHHHTHGDMGLAYALHYLEIYKGVRLTNYGEYLERYPPSHEVEIVENTAWSCSHGIGRWQRNCGCSAGRPGWNQEWRQPLREALDWLRDALAPLFEDKARELLKDPWAARDAYIAVILDRSDKNLDKFFDAWAGRPLNGDDRVTVLKLLEMQRHAMLMYTSCGWFFDELSGLETVQIIQYAGRAIQLAHELFGNSLESEFLQRLEHARSNLPEFENGRVIYERLIKPTMIDWNTIGAHYAVSSLFESYEPRTSVFCYAVEREDFHALEVGRAKLVVGRARMISQITQESAVLTFGAVHFGDHHVNGGVRAFQGLEKYSALVEEMKEVFQRADFSEIIRLMDRGFGDSAYSLKSLFRDEQRKITKQVLHGAQLEAEHAYSRLYEQNLPTMRYLHAIGVPLPRTYQMAADFVIYKDLRWAVDEDEPKLQQIRALIRDAALWKVSLDTVGLAYRFSRTITRMAERLREHVTHLAHLQTLEETVELAKSLPFEVNLWRCQNVYFEIMSTGCRDVRARAENGDEEAQSWLGHFIALGEKLGIDVEDLKKNDPAAHNHACTVKSVVQEALTVKTIPGATYRLQLNKNFTLRDAEALVGYLHDLGISDAYISPIQQARPGSLHGYDICDHSRINAELGGEEAFNAFANTLRKHAMGLIIDVVPNHMGINHPSNGWWMDVLENGPSSKHARNFDIDWHPVNPYLEGKVLLPLLEELYGTVLENGKIQLAFEEGAFTLCYYDHRLPVAPGSYPLVLEPVLTELSESLGTDHENVLELHSILTALNYLPPRKELPPRKVVERNREKEIIKRRIAALAAASTEVRTALEKTVRRFNGSVGTPESFDPLDKLIENQAYRLTYWRVATEEINYRRFFDISELAAIRVELPDVFQGTHGLILNLLAQGKVTGVRVDHPDGLWNPTTYFRRLQEHYLLNCVHVRLNPNRPQRELEQEVAALLSAHLERTPLPHAPYPLYVVAEKILGENEPLPQDWAVSGTTGYDFLNAVNGLLVDGDAAAEFDEIYSRFIGARLNFLEMVISNQKMIMLIAMASELNSLSHQLDRISERNRRYRDFTLNSLTFAIREIIACLMIYRTYITGPERVALRDRLFIEGAVELAKKKNPRTPEAIFDFICDTLMLRNLSAFQEGDRRGIVDWVMKFQQLTGPVLAKAMEDTTFYVYNRLVSLNDVGGNPGQFGVSVQSFHRQNAERREHWPHAMLTTSTHDTKRSEDVRARLNVLSELSDEWQAALERWSRLNAGKKTLVENKPAPDANTEYLLYQTLLGAWPVEPLDAHGLANFRDRIINYMHKATKEAKTHTSWINPHEEYDNALRDFIQGILPDAGDDPFRADLQPLQRRVAWFGYFNSLSQVLLKLASPGVPDCYQGTELWDLSLVDPDNRRPVDYPRRQRLLSELKARIDIAGSNRIALVQELLAHIPDGRIKLYLIYCTLNYRRNHRRLFIDGDYQALQVHGTHDDHVCAFTRNWEQESVLVAAPRLLVRLTGKKEIAPVGEAVWKDTWLAVSGAKIGDRYRNLFTGEMHVVDERDHRPSFAAADIFRNFPVAILAQE
jgi:(1->4)-alpha-D-glucan 1-alpha-D-glucosylmutase